jgi:1-acyl-sn-glycerol-3-phosphate acyltransferase
VLRAFLAVPLIALGTVALGAPAIAAGLVDRTGRLCHDVARLWGRLVLGALGVRVSVSGAENVPAGPAVFAANHASALDIPILFGHLPAPFRIIHKRSLHLIPVIGWILYLGGHIGIDRGNAFRARRSLEAAAVRIRRGTSVAVFPEGTRSPDGEVKLFKRGSFVLALNAGAPVVPVSLRGVKRVAPRGLPSLAPGTIEMVVHSPIAASGRGPEAAEELAKRVRGVVIAGCREA